jgi:recombination protein RecR
MEPFLPDSVRQAVRLLARFPSIGERSALRLALFLLRQPATFREQLAAVLGRLGDEVGFCPDCRNLSDAGRPCPICESTARDPAQLCVVEGVADLIAIEHSGQFQGRYHVLHGVLSPMKGVGPRDLGLPELEARVKRLGLAEVILATNMSVEGEATASYIADLLGETGARVTRIAAGIPMGSALEFLDGMTIGNALRERRDVLQLT